MLMPKKAKLALALSLALAASAPVFAQQTAANLGGRVMTETSGQPVVGAEVTIIHAPSGTTSRAVTDASGRFNARGLRVGGPYTIMIEKDGDVDVQQDVYLQLGEPNNVNSILREAQRLDTVEVTGVGVSNVFSPTAVGTGTTLSQQQIEAAPSIARNIQDYIRLDPRIAQSDKNRGEISAGGQNSRFNNIRIDGVSTNDSFGLESNNLPTNRQPISIDAIEQINVSLANYDVSLGGYTGASVDAVTKSGTNDFSGSVYGIYRDDSWSRDEQEGSNFAPPQEQSYGFTLGGPIIKDTLFFFLSYENFERELGAITSTPDGITAAQIAEVQQIASDVWGIDAGSFQLPGKLTFDIEDVLVKVDWNINENHRASFRYNNTEQTEPFLRNINNNNLSLSSHWQTSLKSFESYVGQLYSDWSDNFSTEFKVSRAEQVAEWDLFSRLPQIRVCLNSPTGNCASANSVFIGSEQFRHVNLIDNTTDTVFGSASYFVGDHEIKFGFDHTRLDVFNLFGRDVYGVYEFHGLDAFRNGTPGFYSLRYPVNGDLNSIAAAFEMQNTALFLQDTWFVSNNLTVNYGVRVDRPKIDDRPAFNPLGLEAFGLRNDTTIDGNRLVQPRFGLNYTFDTERPTQLRAGFGLFGGQAANVWLANPFQNNGGMTLGVFQSNTGAGVEFSPDPDNQPGERIDPNNPQLGGALDFVDPDLYQPAVWKANIALDHELPWWGLVASAELLITEVKEGIYYEHLNLGDPNGRLPDGRMHYWQSADSGPGSQFGGGQNRFNRDRRFTDVTIARPTNKGRGQQATLSVSKQIAPREQGLFGTLAYTYTEATEVNPLTSSQAVSNWANSFRLNPNENRSERSIYEIRNRVLANVGWQGFFFGENRTSFNMIYEGRSGRPYTYSFINDANGDGRVNDPFYMPLGPGDVEFTGGAEMEQAFFDWVSANTNLDQYRGRTAPVGGERAGFLHNFDLRISQELGGFFGRDRAEIWLDILNVGNLINKDWGRIEEVQFPFGRGVASFAGVNPATGNYVYTFNEAAADQRGSRLPSPDLTGSSRWALQLGFRYKF